MWDDIVKNLKEYPSAVLTGLDENGYPISVRCKPEPIAAKRALRVRQTNGTGIQPGPAGLLCHRHDEWLWNLKSFLVRGRLERDLDGWILRPRRVTRGTSKDLPGLVRLVRDGRRNSRRYLRERGISRPSVPWDDINETWERVAEDLHP
jgi:hypothetical protein